MKLESMQMLHFIHDQNQKDALLTLSLWMFTVNLWMKSHPKVSKYAMRDQTSK